MLFEALERLLNRCVSESTPARERLGRLAGKRLAVEIVGFDVTAMLTAHADRLDLGRADDGPAANVTIRATPLELLKLGGPDALARLRETRAEIRGELSVAEDFAELLRLARPDAEEELARVIGDLPAHALGEGARRLAGWSARAHGAMEENLAEFLQEESDLLPHRTEYSAFAADVEAIRDEVERCAQRAARVRKAAGA